MKKNETTAEIAEMLTKNPQLKEIAVLSMKMLETFRTLSPMGKAEVIQHEEEIGEHELAEALRTVAKDMEKWKGDEE